MKSIFLSVFCRPEQYLDLRLGDALGMLFKYLFNINLLGVGKTDFLLMKTESFINLLSLAKTILAAYILLFFIFALHFLFCKFLNQTISQESC